MQSSFTLSKRADQQAKQIYWDTVREWGVSQADKYIDEMENTLKLIVDNPDLGRSCEEIRAGYRRFEYGRHVIFYRKRAVDIFVVQIIHDRMDAIRHL